MLKCTHSGDRLALNQSVGCGNLVSELRNTGKRHLRFNLRFKLLANSKPSTKLPVLSDVATAPLPQLAPSTAPSVLTSHQPYVPTGPPTSSTTTHYPLPCRAISHDVSPTTWPTTAPIDNTKSYSRRSTASSNCTILCSYWTTYVPDATHFIKSLLSITMKCS